MTKTESRNAVEVDELPWWDATEAPDQDDERARAARLAAYSHDSEQRTLVGIGPLGRARPSHAVAAPQSERMPQSEPPGPFIEDDEELTAAPRGRSLGKRAVAICLVLLVPLAAVGLLRSGEPPKESARVAAGPPVSSAALASASKASPIATDEGAQHATQEALETQTPVVAPVTETRNAPPPASGDQSGKQSRSATSAERSRNEPAPPSVKLVEVPALPAVVDWSNGDSNAGTINVMSTPPASVVLDGRPVGKSPSMVRVPAGSHTLVFIHPLYGRRSISIHVLPGVTTTASTEF